MKPNGSEAVKHWVAAQANEVLYMTSITQAEILYGIGILPEGKRSQDLLEAARLMFVEDFAGKILAFDERAAFHFASIASARRKLGQPISQFDAQIAAICRANSAALATRNTKDFSQCDIEILNPWERERSQ